MNYKITKSVFFLALGKSGQKLLEKFLEYQLQEKIKERNERELEHMDTILTNIWLFAPLVVGYIIIVFTAFEFHNAKYEQKFRFAALLMGGTYLLFLFGYTWYSREDLAVESNILRSLKSATQLLGI